MMIFVHLPPRIKLMTHPRVSVRKADKHSGQKIVIKTIRIGILIGFLE